MTTSSEPGLRLRNPTDVLGAVPYLLGFHPADSVVVLGMCATRLVFHARGDLPATGATARDVLAVAAEFADLFADRDIESVLIAGYGTDERVAPLLDELERAMFERGIEVVEMLRAADGRYWSYVCTEGCCPPEGKAYATGDSEIAALATLAGCVAMPDRDSVIRSLDPPAGPALTAIVEATGRAGDRLIELLTEEPHGEASAEAAGSAALTTAFLRYSDGGRLTDDELAWLTIMLTMDGVRDAAWRRIELDGADDWEAHGQLWTDVLSRCDPALAAPPGVLLAYVMWLLGDGVRAGAAVERALTADAGYRSARLMAQVINRGLPPPTLDQLPGRLPHPRARQGRRPQRRRVARRRKR